MKPPIRRDAEIAALRAQVDRLAALPAVAESIAADDAKAGTERAQLIAQIEAATAGRRAALARLAPAIEEKRAGLQRALGALREAQGALAQAEGELSVAERAADSAIERAEAALASLGGAEVEALLADMRREIVQADGLQDFVEVGRKGGPRPVVPKFPVLAEHAARVRELLPKAEALRLARLSPAQIAREVDALRAAARLGFAFDEGRALAERERAWLAIEPTFNKDLAESDRVLGGPLRIAPRR
ncbi:hypothetical protein FBR04_08415 [Betaproteobacteria bacterium PRO7]|jgi:hypothetical protein|nr:hypothetical protein [Betaproteobacteria bacterium PRO7]